MYYKSRVCDALHLSFMKSTGCITFFKCFKNALSANSLFVMHSPNYGEGISGID